MIFHTVFAITFLGFIFSQSYSDSQAQFLNIRKNINANNPGYGKYYPKAVEKETITLRGLAKHMSEHQCVYSRDIIEGVLIKMASCMIELIAQGMRRGIKTKTPPGADRWGFCGAYEIRTRDLLRDRQAF